MKQILLPINASSLESILNKEVTALIYSYFPDNYKGWVNLYCNKSSNSGLVNMGKNILEETLYVNALIPKYNEDYDWFRIEKLNGKVVCRFWVDKVETAVAVKNLRSKVVTINKLEIFEVPKQLNHYYNYKKRWVDCGMDCPPYYDEVKISLTRTPRPWCYIYNED